MHMHTSMRSTNGPLGAPSLNHRFHTIRHIEEIDSGTMMFNVSTPHPHLPTHDESYPSFNCQFFQCISIVGGSDTRRRRESRRRKKHGNLLPSAKENQPNGLFNHKNLLTLGVAKVMSKLARFSICSCNEKLAPSQIWRSVRSFATRSIEHAECINNYSPTFHTIMLLKNSERGQVVHRPIQACTFSVIHGINSPHPTHNRIMIEKWQRRKSLPSY